MKFETLKDKCEYYRGLSDIKLIPNMPVLVMLDGHCFLKLLKSVINYLLMINSLI